MHVYRWRRYAILSRLVLIVNVFFLLILLTFQKKNIFVKKDHVISLLVKRRKTIIAALGLSSLFEKIFNKFLFVIAIRQCFVGIEKSLLVTTACTYPVS